MRTIKTYRKVGAFYIACEADLSIPIREPAAPGPFAGLVSGYATYQDLPPRSCYKSCSLIRDGAHQPKEE